MYTSQLRFRAFRASLGLFTLPWTRRANPPRNLPMAVRLRLPDFEALDNSSRSAAIWTVKRLFPGVTYHG